MDKRDIRGAVLAVRERIERARLIRGGTGGDEVVLVAAAKSNSAEIVRRAIDAGVDAIGENRAQEMRDKHALGAYEGTLLHFIGRLQRNKVRNVVGIADLIQSVDSEALLREIDRRAALLEIIQDLLFEINIAGENSKGGIIPEQLPELMDMASGLRNIRVRGLMSIPPLSAETGGNSQWFAGMYKLFVDNKGKRYDNVSMDFLSMGMSGDFEDAISEGANMVRLGTVIFGER